MLHGIKIEPKNVLIGEMMKHPARDREIVTSASLLTGGKEELKAGQPLKGTCERSRRRRGLYLKSAISFLTFKSCLVCLRAAVADP